MLFYSLLAIWMAAAARGQHTSGQSMTTNTTSLGSASSSTYMPIFGVGTTTIPVSGVAGSIVGVDSTATTVALACDGVTSCLMGTNTVTLTQGPSTMVADIVTQADTAGYDGTITAAVACNIVSSTQAATCVVTGTLTFGVQSQSSSLTITTTTTISSMISYEQVLITAGVEKMNNPSAAATQTTQGTQATQGTPATQTSRAAAGLVAAPVPTGNMALGVGAMAAAAVVAVAGIL